MNTESTGLLCATEMVYEHTFNSSPRTFDVDDIAHAIREARKVKLYPIAVHLSGEYAMNTDSALPDSVQGWVLGVPCYRHFEHTDRASILFGPAHITYQ
jgi:hypothetical protein